MNSNPYLDEVHAALPRLLGLFDTNRSSPTYGIGDRQYWAWKVKDFADGTYQCVAGGLARLVASGSLPEHIHAEAILRRLDAIVGAIAHARASDGSLAEAYPRESSFCVTALAVFDVLCALEQLSDRLSAPTRQAWLAQLEPMVSFLQRADETHGLICNHLATGAAALLRWSTVTGAPERRARRLLERVLAAQSEEGWYPEYGGADPGYLTLCLYFLADAHTLRPDLGLEASLARAVRFAAHFAHPDGSFGGVYGWRGTRFLCPTAFEMLAARIPEAASLAAFARRATGSRTIPVLSGLDEPNLAALFGPWCRAAVACAQRTVAPLQPLPFERATPSRIEFRAAGLLLDAGQTHYTVIATRKGGVVYHFENSLRRLASGGILARDARGRWFTTQALWPDVEQHLDHGELRLDLELCAPSGTPSRPWMLVALRLLALTFFRYRPLNEWFKRIAAARLMLRPNRVGVRASRRIRLGPDLTIQDEFSGDARDLQLVASNEPFSAIHMASQGYWQVQDDAS